ncbi:MAG: SlyX family protein [Polyangiaceae bacterium]|nr:SlyX family protein [Polyangiaceae bacterium]MBK8937347.1 SlyX family protein [Polyangiaceae bacterium]
MDERLTDLEIRYTHQERLVEDLSRVVHEQRALIDRLDGRVKELERRLFTLEDPTPNEVPPHY